MNADDDPADALHFKKAHFAAALEVWKANGSPGWMKPDGPCRGLTPEVAAEIERDGYPTEFLPERCPDPAETPTLESRKSIAEGRDCWSCGIVDDPHLLFSFYCGKCCHSVKHHIPTVESLARFGESLRATIQYAKLGGSDSSFLGLRHRVMLGIPGRKRESDMTTERLERLCDER